VAIALFLSIYFVNVALTTMRAKASDEVNMHAVSEMARNRLRFCYGQNLDNITGDCLVNGIDGYEIKQIAYGVCDDRLIKAEGPRESKTTTVAYVPIFNYDLNVSCLAKIVIYI
jgi:non-homologous end joining protein Ku